MGNSEAWIFTLGNEVVHGRVVNTNAAYLGKRLFVLGFKVMGNISLVDDVALIVDFLKFILCRKPRLVVTTGGLGPTYDDRTLEAVALALGRELKLNREAYEMIESKYAKKGLGMTEERVKMSLLPDGAVPIPNPVGTAPGSWVEHEGTIVVSLPGVPRELEAMWEGWVEPRLRNIGLGVQIAEKTFRVIGVPESSAAKVVKAVLKRYGRVYIKTHPKGHEIDAPVLDVYVLASAKERKDAEEIAESIVRELMKELASLGGTILHEPE